MIMPCMRIYAPSRFTLERHLHLVGTAKSNYVTGKECTVVFGDNMGLIAMLFMNGNSLEMISVLLEDETIDSLAHDGIDRQYDLFGPLRNWYS